MKARTTASTLMVNLKRSMVENTMCRYKTIIGWSMRSRDFDGQRVEGQLASGILNMMTLFGMPDSYQVE